MTKLTVKVNKLNKRKAPVTDFEDRSNVIGTVKKGYTFENHGEISNVLGKWHVDADGYYYWAEGLAVEDDATQQINFVQQFNFVEEKMSWAHGHYQIPSIWSELKTAGKGVTVAVIDTGIDESHQDFSGLIHPLSKSFVAGSTSINDEDGHGTKMAGIIGAKGRMVYGVAPDVNLLILKAAKFGAEINLAAFTNAVDFAAGVADVDIISISYSFHQLIVNSAFEKAIQKCVSAKKIIVAAIGNSHLELPDPPTFPACYNLPFPNRSGILAVGAVDASLNWCSFSNSNLHLRCLAPGSNVLTTQKPNTKVNDTGTSIAAAFTAACLALLVSYCKMQHKDVDGCLPALLNGCNYTGNEDGFDMQHGYGVLDLAKSIAILKNNAI